MIGTIPTVSRAAGTRRWIPTALIYLAASTLAATLFGAFLSLAGLPVATALGPQARALVTVAVAFVFGLVELGVLTAPRPQRHAQVPAEWRRRFPPEVTAGLYGGILGIGVLTSITFASFYVLLVWTLLRDSILEGAITFGAFGLARAAPVAILSPFLGRPGVATSLIRALEPYYQLFRQITGWALVGLAVAAAVPITFQLVVR